MKGNIFNSGRKTFKNIIPPVFALLGCLLPVLTLGLIYLFYMIPAEYKPYITDLSGKWKIMEGFKKEWLEKDFDDSNWSYITLPGSYYKQGFRERLSVLRKSFKLTGNLKDDDLFFMIGGTLGSMGDVYLNGSKVGEIGLFINKHRTQATDDKYGFYINRQLVYNEGNNVIAISFTHETLGYDGVQDPRILIGKAGYLKTYFDRVVFINSFFQHGIILSSIFVFAIILLLLITEWNTGDRYRYVSSLLFITAAIFYNFFFSNSFMKYIMSFSLSIKFLKSSIVFICIASLEFLQYFFLRKTNIIAKINRYVCLAVIASYFISDNFAVIQSIYSYFVYYFFIVILYMCIMSLVYTLLSRDKRFGVIIASSIITASAAGVSDLLTNLGFIHMPLFFNISISVYITLSSIVIIAEFIKISDTNKRLSDELRVLNATLEAKVDERTKDLKILNEKLKKLNVQKNDFIANITHDFRSPLTAILNVADLALKTNNFDDANNYEIIYEASLKLNNSIDRLLELARLDSQGVKLKIQKTDPALLLSEILNFYSSSLIGTDITIIKMFPVKRIDDFYTDREKFEEVINNIISNAIKFCNPENGIIRVNLKEKKASILITIQDNGIGIPKNKLRIIFNRFERLHNDKNRIYRGTGIGLAFSKQLLKFLKGRIWAESEGENKGAKFSIELKKGRQIFKESDFVREEIHAGRIRDNFARIIKNELISKNNNASFKAFFRELNKENEFDFKKGKILIIDDDENTREIVMKYLVKHGYMNFITAGDGKNGLDAVYRLLPDLIICDYNMPNMTGDVFHDILLGNAGLKRIPLVFLSAVQDRNIIITRRQKGASAYLKKPIDENDLVLAVDQYIKNHFEYLSSIRLSTTDEYTGLMNKRGILKRLDEYLSGRNYRALSLILLDVDDMNRINNEYGHQSGDAVISGLANILKSSLRSYDIPGRYESDEFLIILQDTSLPQAIKVAEELKQKINEHNFEFNNRSSKITASFGIASLKDNEDYISGELGLENLSGLFDTIDKENADWKNIEEKKHKLGEIMLNLADILLIKAKLNSCNNCGFNSPDIKKIQNKTCPQCGSKDVSLGKNRIMSL